MTVPLHVVLSERSLPSLAERLRLIDEAAPGAAVSILPQRVAEADDGVTYVIDVNRHTLPVIRRHVRARRPFVLDVGDERASLTSQPGRAFLEGVAERWAMRHAALVVCRGHFHVPLLRARTDAYVHVAPDTFDPSLLLREVEIPRPGLIGTFGSSYARDSGPTFGVDILMALKLDSDLSGVMVIQGSGLNQLHELARTWGVASRLELHAGVTLDRLPEVVAQMGTVASFQEDRVAGWVRTTGKLPIALALGRHVITTNVGEATLVLPEAWRFPGHPVDREHFASWIVQEAWTPKSEDVIKTARSAAHGFSRSVVAERLRGSLERMLMV